MRRNNKEKINVVVLGHFDSGKSTAIGHLVSKCSDIDKQTIESLEIATQYTAILDNLKAERERGVTIDAGFCKFETPKSHVTVTDTPGHCDFVKNMITGASEADCGILFVSAAPGEFEAGISTEGQTVGHANLAYILGIRQLIVAVNKMDVCCWSEERYNEICGEMLKLLKKAGYKTETIPMIPMSGLHGDNVLKVSTNMPWFKRASTLVGAIDAVGPRPTLTEKPLRLPIQDVYKIAGIGAVPVGRVESGTLRPGMSIVFAPSGISSEVVALEVHSGSCEGVPGDNIGFSLKDVAFEDIHRGDVVSDKKDGQAKEAVSFIAQVIVLNLRGKLSSGYKPMIDIHTARVVCEWTELIAKIDRRTNRTIEEAPTFLKSGDSAIVRIVPKEPLCVEAFRDFPALGRFAIRDVDHTIAIGVIMEVEKSKKSQ